MRIFGSYDPIRPASPVSPVAPANTQGTPPTPVAPVTPVDRSDSVQLSENGKSMARKLQAEHADSFDPERTAELRRKVLDGAYNTLDVVDQVARRILQRGDL